MSEQTAHPDPLRLAEAIREACLRAALGAFEDASLSGLCCAGAFECAVGAVRALDLEEVLQAQRVPPCLVDPETTGDVRAALHPPPENVNLSSTTP